MNTDAYLGGHNQTASFGGANIGSYGTGLAGRGNTALGIYNVNV